VSRYKIWPLRTGTIIVDKGQYITRGIDVGLHVPIPATAWYVSDGRRHVLVDTGMCHTELAHWHHPGSCQEDDQSIVPQLERLGVAASDIELIVFTHLHWDHCHNVDAFPNARLVVSQQELMWALDPHPLFFKSYEDPRITSRVAPFRGSSFETTHGEAEVIEGISVFPTVGHTPGHQSVAVDTDHGVHVITGDACFAYVNLEPASATLRFTIMGRVMDLLAAWRSLEVIAERADVVLPAHDDAVYDHECYPLIGARGTRTFGTRPATSGRSV
jgi:glyoxylase-like metal-dependent hydrolase (beta-lactamase superfamily II)